MPHFWTKMDWSIPFLYFFINWLIASPSLEPGNDYSHINKYYSALFWTWFLMKFIIFDFSVHELALDLYNWLSINLEFQLIDGLLFASSCKSTDSEIINPHWQILEKSSRNFPKYLIAGSSARPFYWKNNPIFIRNLNFGAMS